MIICLPDGSLDNTFGISGQVLSDFGSSYPYASSVEINSLNDIIVGGNLTDQNEDFNFFMAKFTANGAAFPGFGINGLSVTSIGQLDFEADVEVYTNGKIVAAEMTGDDVHHDFIVQRYFDGVSAGYGDLTKESQVEIFPNPVSDHLNIRMNDEKELSIAILNANCKEVYRSQLESKNNRIDVSDLPSGVYFLLFKQQDKLILCKIMAKI